MKIFVALLKYDYGIIKNGLSYEYYNVYLPLCDAFGVDNVVLFDYLTEVKQKGKAGMNKILKEIITSEKPDISIFCLFTDEFDEATLSSLRRTTKTIVYFFDDPWRQQFARHWIDHFDYFTTSDFYMFKKYKLEGFRNVIYSPFGFNKNIYKKLDLPIKYEISFVGGYSPLRKWIMKRLEKEKLKVKIFGNGWGGDIKRAAQEEMVEIFNQSKINLNLSNAVYKDLYFLIWSIKSLKNIKQLLLLEKAKEQVKGRHYEINACGGFQLSYFIPGLNLVYELDKEIAVYDSVDNISELTKYFLSDEDTRKSIAEKGYERSQRDHTAQNYLKNMVHQAIELSK